MYSVTVSDHIMIAHSLRGDVFGPSQRLHGATYSVEAEFTAERLDPNGIVVDIGLATGQLRTILDVLDRQNLDDLEQFAQQNTTTEVLAHYIAEEMAERIAGGALGESGGDINAIAVTLRESPTAWARYERAL